jgi:hypothetical protein
MQNFPNSFVKETTKICQMKNHYSPAPVDVSVCMLLYLHHGITRKTAQLIVHETTQSLFFGGKV